MFKIENGNMLLNRGDSATIRIENTSSNFLPGDCIKFSIMEKNNCNSVIFQKRYDVIEQSETEPNVFEITLAPEDSKKFCPSFKTGTKTFWYEIELESGDFINTLVGYDDQGAKEFIVFPEASEETESV